MPFQTKSETLWFLLLEGGIVGVFAIEFFQCFTELLSSRLVFNCLFRMSFLTQRPVLNSNSTANTNKILLPCTTSFFPAVLTYCAICLELFFSPWLYFCFYSQIIWGTSGKRHYFLPSVMSYHD